MAKKSSQIGPAAGTSSGRDADEDDYLAALGNAVRRHRTQRGMSRKALAETSGISERYIAQLESGQGNLSVLLIRRIAAAAGTTVSDLLTPASDQRSEWAQFRQLLQAASPASISEALEVLSRDAHTLETGRAQRVALIGLRGAGKSTLGRLAADRLGWQFVELNREIERDVGFTVTEIFAIYGQDGFRRHEQAALQSVRSRPGPLLLATGGGIVGDPVTLDMLLSSFFTVWIQATPEEHMGRVRAQGDLRPMGNHRNAMRELIAILSSREPLYRRADATVNTSGTGIDVSADRLIEVVRGAHGHERRKEVDRQRAHRG